MKYDRTVIAYHGCDEKTARQILDGKPFRRSQNEYDWLGAGIYFWEYGADRATRFAEDQKRRGKVQTPAIVGALIQLGRCFDLMDTKFTDELPQAFGMLCALNAEQGTALPVNAGSTRDKERRHLDCAVLNLYFRALENAPKPVRYDTVRCGFVEGDPAYPGSGIARQSHVQVAVRSPRCIVGVFRPRIGA